MTVIGRRIVPAVPPLAGIDLSKPEGVEKLQESLRSLEDFLGVVRDSLDEGAPVPHADVTHNLNTGDDPLPTAIPANPTGPVALLGAANSLLRSDCTIKQGIVTVKGDLLGFSTVPAKVAVGTTDGQVLTVDPTAALGVAWEDPAVADILDGIHSFWKLDETEGELRRDSIGLLRFNDLTEQNGVGQATGKLGNAAFFVAANSENLSILDAIQQGLNPGLYDLELSIWFYPIGTTGAGNYWLAGKGLTGGGAFAEGYRIIISGSTAAKPRVVSAGFCDSVAAGGVLTSSLTEQYTLNAWNHAYAYWDRDGTAHVYLNGVKITVDPAFGGTDDMSTVTADCTPSAAFALASHSDNGGGFGTYFDGRLDACAVGVHPVTVQNIAARAAAFWNDGKGRELGPLWGPNVGSVLTPAQITAAQNNYSPGRAHNYRLSSDASRNVTGLFRGLPGEVRYAVNVGTQNIVLKNNDGASDPANRFITPGAADLTLNEGDLALLLYDAVIQRWRAYELAGGTSPAGWNQNWWGPPVSMYFG